VNPKAARGGTQHGSAGSRLARDQAKPSRSSSATDRFKLKADWSLAANRGTARGGAGISTFPSFAAGCPGRQLGVASADWREAHTE